MTATSWVAQTSVTKSATALLGLVSGSRQWVRVRAVGSAGTGAGCDRYFLTPTSHNNPSSISWSWISFSNVNDNVLLVLSNLCS
jgi:hypothetical protein